MPRRRRLLHDHIASLLELLQQVRGRDLGTTVLEAQKKFPQALEAYLTVKTMFYQNQALVEESDQLVQKLRATDPGVSVN